jgi:translation initiation factor 2B subunit (eIF-2B alpha/beta/delta family)
MPESSRDLINQRLNEKNELKRLETIKAQVGRLWSGKRYIPEYYTFHDSSHCNEVENAIYKLIPCESVDHFNDKELFYLISAVWLHDVGMIPDPKVHNLSKENIPNSIIGAALSKIYNDDKHEYVSRLLSGDSEIYREVHHLLSKKYVEDNFRDLGLMPNEAGIIGELCKYHRKSEDLSSHITEVHDVDIRTLAAYLRLADAIHINPNRIDEDLFTLFTQIGMPTESMLHWLKNLCTANVIADNKDSSIIVEVIRSENGPKDINLIADYIREEIEAELLSVKDILAQGNISYYSEVKTRLIPGAFSDRDKILIDQIISKLQLKDKSSASDVLDSVIKSILSIMELPDRSANKYSMIKWYHEEVIKKLLIDRPCHVLVRHIDELLERELRIDEKNQSEEEIKKILGAIKGKITKFRDERKLCLDKLSHYTGAILGDYGSILLFGHSRLVIKALEKMDRDIKDKTEIYVCEARNLGHYNSLNELSYSNGIAYASSIANCGYKKVNLVPDIAVASLMSRNLINKVIFGATGVDIEKGIFGHSVGHLTVADLAYLYGIPVYTILDSFKFGDVEEGYDLMLVRKNNWLTSDKKILSKLGGVKLFNPREDLIREMLNNIKIDRFTALITDYGIIRANNIPNRIKKNVNEI